MATDLKQVCGFVAEMESFLCTHYLGKDWENQKKKLWENTFCRRQIKRRSQGESFSVEDHIRAMVYSMLSGGIVWDRVANDIDEKTKRITSIDKIFRQYDIEFLLQCEPAALVKGIKERKCASFRTRNQMEALIGQNISKLLKWEREYGSVDAFYQTYTEKDSSLKSLIQTLSGPGDNKLRELGVALAAEYLKNVGYIVAKPDRHIRRILGKKVLGCSDRDCAQEYEAIDLVAGIAELTGKSAAQVDYILWSYCAKGYGEICTAKHPNCGQCVIKEGCQKYRKEGEPCEK